MSLNHPRRGATSWRAVLLQLPVASRSGHSHVVAALCTAISEATRCTTVDTDARWCPFSQCVILALIRVGGFGLTTPASTGATASGDVRSWMTRGR